MLLKPKTLLTFLLSTAAIHAAPVTFDFDTPTAGLIGYELIGDSTGSVTAGGITLTATVFPSGTFNQTGSGFGINAAGSGDDSDEFDPGEGFTFSFDQAVIINSLTVSSFGGSSVGLLSYDGGAVIANITSTGTTTVTSSLIASGTTLRFESTSGVFSLDAITVTAIPEPASTAALVGAAFFAIAATRRRGLRTSSVRSPKTVS
jgi:hypothetical protein